MAKATKGRCNATAWPPHFISRCALFAPRCSATSCKCGSQRCMPTPCNCYDHMFPAVSTCSQEISSWAIYEHVQRLVPHLGRPALHSEALHLTGQHAGESQVVPVQIVLGNFSFCAASWCASIRPRANAVRISVRSPMHEESIAIVRASRELIFACTVEADVVACSVRCLAPFLGSFDSLGPQPLVV